MEKNLVHCILINMVHKGSGCCVGRFWVDIELLSVGGLERLGVLPQAVRPEGGGQSKNHCTIFGEAGRIVKGVQEAEALTEMGGASVSGASDAMSPAEGTGV